MGALGCLGRLTRAVRGTWRGASAWRNACDRDPTVVGGDLPTLWGLLASLWQWFTLNEP